MKALAILEEMEYAYNTTGTPDMIGITEAIAELKLIQKQLNKESCEGCLYNTETDGEKLCTSFVECSRIFLNQNPNEISLSRDYYEPNK